ncbi:hypothetical protein ACA910_007054 [Epithemia clementina (nom. ined.)]
MWMKKHHCPPAERNKEHIWNVWKEHVLPKLLRIVPSVADDDHPTTFKALSPSPPLRILEVAAGSGVHTVYLSRRLFHYLQEHEHQHQHQQQREEQKEEQEPPPQPRASSTLSTPPFVWQSTDPDPSARESQQAYVQEDLAANEDHALLLRSCVADTPLPLTLTERGVVEPETRAILMSSTISSSATTTTKWDLMVNVNMIHIAPWEATQGLFVLAKELLRPGRGLLYLYGPFYVAGTTPAPSNVKFDQFLKAKDARNGIRRLEDVVALAQDYGLELVTTVDMPAHNLSVIFSKTQPNDNNDNDTKMTMETK